MGLGQAGGEDSEHRPTRGGVAWQIYLALSDRSGAGFLSGYVGALAPLFASSSALAEQPYSSGAPQRTAQNRVRHGIALLWVALVCRRCFR